MPTESIRVETRERTDAVLPLAEVADACASCGSPLAGPFCAQCGERRLEDDDRSLRRYLIDDVGEVASVDGKLLRTLRLLVAKPGQLTLEFLRGRRVSYLKPLQIFLLANLAYFVMQPLSAYRGYNTTLAMQMGRQFYSEAADIAGTVERTVAERATTLESYAAVYDAKSEIYAQTLILLMIPLFALAVGLLQLRARRRFVDHVVFVTHYFAWELLVVSTLFLLVYPWVLQAGVSGLVAAGVPLAGPDDGPLAGTVWLFLNEFPTMPIIVAYLALAFRRVYGNSRVGAALRALASFPLLMATMLAYRFMLFWITYATI
jgi:hypothetical protein